MYVQITNPVNPNVEAGFCACECGSWIGFWDKDNAKLGRVRGFPKSFKHNHHGRCTKGPQYREEDHGYETLCWVWNWCVDPISGYGVSNWNGKDCAAHRMMYLKQVGPIPEGLELDHLCRVRACCNPHHLEPVTRAENVRRGANAKLTYASAAAVREAEGNQIDIAKDFGVSPACVSHVKTGRSWS